MKIFSPFLALGLLITPVSPLSAGTPMLAYLDAFGSAGTGNGQFDFPYGVAVNGSKVYVTDYQNNRVERFNGTGTFKSAWGATGILPTQFVGPAAVAALKTTGDVYVTDISNNRVQRFTDNGGFVSMWGGTGTGDGQMDGPSGLAINQTTGDIFVTEQGGNRVQQFNSNGAFKAKWGSGGLDNGKFSGPDGIAVDPSTGQVYVSEFTGNRVQRFSAAGVYETQWGAAGAGNGQFNKPVGVAVDGQGRVWVADSGNNRVQVFTADGVFLTKFGDKGKGKFQKPYSIAFGPGAIAFVVDNGNNRVSRWQVTEQPVVTINGKKKRTVTTAKVTIRGKAKHANGSPTLKSVSATVGNKTYKVTGTANWQFIAKLKPGKNKITVVATDKAGITSVPVAITVIRK
jgi:DNA-binding beta-propeller fold protein YncE